MKKKSKPEWERIAGLETDIENYKIKLSQTRKQAIRETLEKVRLEKTKPIPMKGFHFGWNDAVNQLNNLKKKIKEE